MKSCSEPPATGVANLQHSAAVNSNWRPPPRSPADCVGVTCGYIRSATAAFGLNGSKLVSWWSMDCCIGNLTTRKNMNIFLGQNSSFHRSLFSILVLHSQGSFEWLFCRLITTTGWTTVLVLLLITTSQTNSRSNNFRPAPLRSSLNRAIKFSTSLVADQSADKQSASTARRRNVIRDVISPTAPSTGRKQTVD